MEHPYIIVGVRKGKSTGKVSVTIDTNITNPSVIKDMTNHMNSLFPIYEWDYIKK